MRNIAKMGLITASLMVAGVLSAGNLLSSPEQAKGRRAGKVTHDSQGLLLSLSDPEWSSGMLLNPPAGQDTWDLSRWRVLAMDVENLSADRQMRLTMHLSSGSKGKKDFREVNTGIGLNPGEKRAMRILIPHDFIYAVPKGLKGMRTIDSARVNPIEFQLQWPFEPKFSGLVDCRISNIRGEQVIDPKKFKPMTEDRFFPFIDEYGQFIHADWPEKIRSDADLKRQLKEENAELEKLSRPQEWNKYGGWANGPRLEATGNFRTEKYQGKWYLVDPEGCLFFSHGLDVLYPHTDATKTASREKWFKNPPAGAAEIAFTDRNLKIKYGKDDYEPEFYDHLTGRLILWGFNTIGNWAKGDFLALSRTPYAMQLTDFNSKWPGIQDSKLKFYDVFDVRFEERMGNLLADRAKIDAPTRKSLTDPMCIGYFIDNELKFGDFIRELMKAPPTQPAKIELMKDLRLKYGSIDELNAAWKTRHADWSAMLESRDTPNSDAFKKDSRAFHAKAVDRYFELCRAGIKKVAPHRLYLGSRFVGFRQSDFIWDAAARHCDVISVNTYTHSAANCNPADFRDKPVLIGEFHFGIVDRGMFSPSLCPAGVTQEERAVAYTRFMQGVLVHPNIVGAHWFQFRDQPLTGRWDGEGYQLGFVDVADTPYRELTAAAREVGENMYHYRQRGKLVNSMK